jgi:adenylate cyclase
VLAQVLRSSPGPPSRGNTCACYTPARKNRIIPRSRLFNRGQVPQSIKRRHPGQVSALVAAGLCALVGVVVWSGVLEGVELQGYDLLVASRGAGPPAENILVVDFDEASVRAFNAFPIPRRLLADVLERISAGQPRVIGLDVILDKERAPKDDSHLAEVMGRVGNVILVSEYGFERLPRNEPLPAFAEAAAGVGFGDEPRDADGSVRRTFLLVFTTGYKGLAFPVAVSSYFSQQSLKPGRPGFHQFGNTEIPLIHTNPDSTLIQFWNSFPARTVPVQRLLAPNFDAGIFQGKIVLIGQSSQFGKDLLSTPVFRFRRPREGRVELSGAEVHAAAIETLLSGRTVRKLDARWHWLLSFVLFGLLIAAFVTLRPAYSILLVVAGLGGVYLLALNLFSSHGIWMPFLSTDAGVILALPAGLGYRYLEERRLKSLVEAERRQLMGLFERYVSPEVAAEIWERRNEIVLAGEERVATVLFSDIRSFTAMTEGKPSQEVLAWLNRYLTAMSEVIKANGGFLNKFIGDGIMVIYGVPLSGGPQDDACRAAKTAIEMHEKVEELNAHLEPGQPHLKIGVGLHTGMLTAGNVGSPDRLEYSVIGETVNLASRLESLTKDFRTGIVLSPQTEELVRTNFQTAALGEAEVRGFTGKIPLYTVRKK